METEAQAVRQQERGAFPHTTKDAKPGPELFPLFGGFLVNAVFLLMTSAMLVGQAAEKKATPPAPGPTPAVAAASGPNCGNSDPCGCEGFGQRLRNKLKGLFNRDACDTCQPATCQPSHAHVSFFKKSCDDCGRSRLINWQPTHRPQTCAPTCNDPCANGGLNILGKLRAIFQRRDNCCEGGISSPAAPKKAGEPIQNPGKKMPATTPTTPVVPKTAKPQEVRIETIPVPIAPSIIPVVPNSPAVEITPVPAPRIEGTNRDPF